MRFLLFFSVVWETGSWFWNHYDPTFYRGLKEKVMEAKENFTTTSKIMREGQALVLLSLQKTFCWISNKWLWISQSEISLNIWKKYGCTFMPLGNISGQCLSSYTRCCNQNITTVLELYSAEKQTYTTSLLVTSNLVQKKCINRVKELVMRLLYLPYTWFCVGCFWTNLVSATDIVYSFFKEQL